MGNLKKDWNYQGCLLHVKNLPDGSFLNFSELARDFGLKDPSSFIKDNLNQKVKEFLEKSGIDLNRFKHKKKRELEISEVINSRRKIRKLSSSKISVASDPPLSSAYKDLHDEIQAGKYSLGEIIVPQTFEKCSIVQNELKWEKFTVGGRKNPLKKYGK